MSLNERDKALRALWSQGQTQAVCDTLSAERVTLLAELVADDGTLAADTRDRVAEVLRDHYESLKATTEETDAAEESAGEAIE